MILAASLSFPLTQHVYSPACRDVGNNVENRRMLLEVLPLSVSLDNITFSAEMVELFSPKNHSRLGGGSCAGRVTVTKQFNVKFVPAVLVIVPEGEIITGPISTKMIEPVNIKPLLVILYLAYQCLCRLSDSCR